MISQIRGVVTGRAGDLVTVMTSGGVGYDISVPLGVIERLGKPGEDTHLHTVLVAREEGWSLFGFDRLEERFIFQRLLHSKGVGPRLALALLSALGGQRVVRAVREGDLAALCTVPGVGKKTAERMVLELKDRMGDLEVAPGVGRPSPVVEQAVMALVKLGFGQGEADEAVRAVLAAGGSHQPAQVIRTALQHLAKRV